MRRDNTGGGSVRPVAACTGTGGCRPARPAGAAPAPTAPPAPGRQRRGATPGGTATSSTRRQLAGVRRERGADRHRPPACRPPGALTTAWTAHLDGAVYGQPLVVGGEVIAATENDSIYASTGRRARRSGAPTSAPRCRGQELNGCGDIFPLGITGTPVYDASNGLVYAVAETTGYQHVLVALDAATGTVEAAAATSTARPAANQPAYNQQRPALAIDDGRVYAAFGGLAGDCGAYQGGVVSAPLTGNGPLTSWHTPTSREGAVWGTGGPGRRARTGTCGSPTGTAPRVRATPYDGSDSVTEPQPGSAPPRLLRAAPPGRPTTRATSTSAPPSRSSPPGTDAVFIVGKRGVGYLLSGRGPGRDRRPARRADHLQRLRRARRSAGPWCTSRARDGGMAAV